jgi:hypothetical protein
MSLWLALTWLVSAAICFAVFVFCRKRIADIGEQVAAEIDNRVNKVSRTERDAEARLLEAFSSFDNPAEAVQRYQKTMAEIFACPQAKPPWNWSQEDLDLWRKQTESKERANRSRSTVLAAVIIILALNVGATVATVITLNTVRPVPAIQAGSANIAAPSSSQLPLPVSIPAQSPATSLPPLPTQYPPTPPDDIYNDGTKQSPNDVDSIQNSGDTLNEPSPGPNTDDRILDGSDTTDKGNFFIGPNTDTNTSNKDTCNAAKDVGQDINSIPNCKMTESSDSQSKSKGHKNE